MKKDKDYSDNRLFYNIVNDLKEAIANGADVNNIGISLLEEMISNHDILVVGRALGYVFKRNRSVDRWNGTPESWNRIDSKLKTIVELNKLDYRCFKWLDNFVTYE